MGLTGIKDLDREVLKYVDDIDLLEICSVDKRFWNEVCDDNFLRRRLSKYFEIEKYKKENETWKRFFLRAVNRIGMMKLLYHFEYTTGNFENQYRILDFTLGDHPNYIFMKAVEKGELTLVIYALQKGANFELKGGDALFYAAKNGHLDVVKYLVERGINLHGYTSLLVGPSSRGHSDIVKYLIDKGAPVDWI